MAEVVNAYNAPTGPARLDGVGIWFITFICLWTLILLAAIMILIAHRDDPIVRTRGLYLTLAAVCCLHPFWVIAYLAVPVFPTIPVITAFDMQYFFMGIWLPVGIGLFQLANLRFLYVAKMQKQYTHIAKHLESRCTHCDHKGSWGQRLRNMQSSTLSTVSISIAIVVQMLLTIGIWLMVRKYHPSFGIRGTELPDVPLPEQVWRLNNGWEWWPTVLWQVIWTWICAPILLLKAWHIDDTMGWRLQTVGCCLSGLPATPMYLIASYVPAFKPVNAYWTPSNWITLSLMFWEAFMLFVPCYHLCAHSRLRNQALLSNAKHDFDSQSILTAVSASPRRSSFAINAIEEGLSQVDISEIDQEKLLTLNALDHILRKNPEPLQNFSALRDFSGENIAFLVRAAEWKSASFEHPGATAESRRRIAFVKALEIYAFFISPRYAHFPLNISGRQLQPLVEIFSEAAKTVYGGARKDSAIPSEWDGPSDDDEKSNHQYLAHETSDTEKYDGPVPAAFDEGVFNDVIGHVRQLVFQNTWPKFVRDLRVRRGSVDTQNTETSWASQDTLVERTLNYLKGMYVRKPSV